ncbi:MAG: 2-hydroxyacyl-CoA dehydratase family protein [Thermodesulfobacteriota bacterium]
MKQPIVLDRVFEEMVESPVNVMVDRALESGRKVIGYTCTYVPEPLLNVGPLFGVRLRAPGVRGTPMADTYLSNVICSYTRSLLELALEGAFDTLNGWVFAASCDHMRRLYDNLDYLQPPEFIHILDVPHKKTPAAVAWMAEELSMLAAKLSERFEVSVDGEGLRDSIARYNQYLAVMRELAELRKRDQPPISGTQFMTVMTAASSAPKDLVVPGLQKLLAALQDAPGIDDYRARLVLAGSQCDDPGYTKVIESVGGLVVADRTCIGSIPGLAAVEEGGDPFEILARRSLTNISCPRMMEEFDGRVAEIVEAVRDYKADGVVLQTMKFCDTWGVEASPMVTELRKAGIPVLRLEREYALSSEGQLSTRVQAFLESMGK